MRILYYVPITHTSAEAVTSRKESLKSKKTLHGQETAIFHEKTVYQDWLKIARKIKKVFKRQNLDYSQLFIYQDSWLKDFKVNPTEMQQSGVPNQIILGKLIEKGARLIPVENRKLYERQKEIVFDEEIISLAFEKAQEIEDLNYQEEILKRLLAQQKKLKKESDLVCRKRDKYIAKMINQTLPEDGIGILFIGARHKVVEEPDSCKFKIINLLKGELR